MRVIATIVLGLDAQPATGFGSQPIASNSFADDLLAAVTAPAAAVAVQLDADPAPATPAAAGPELPFELPATPTATETKLDPLQLAAAASVSGGPHACRRDVWPNPAGAPAHAIAEASPVISPPTVVTPDEAPHTAKPANRIAERFAHNMYPPKVTLATNDGAKQPQHFLEVPATQGRAIDPVVVADSKHTVVETTIVPDDIRPGQPHFTPAPAVNTVDTVNTGSTAKHQPAPPATSAPTGSLGMIGVERVQIARAHAPAREVQRLAIDLDDTRVALSFGDGQVKVKVVSDPSGSLTAAWTQQLERTLSSATRAAHDPAAMRHDASRHESRHQPPDQSPHQSPHGNQQYSHGSEREHSQPRHQRPGSDFNARLEALEQI